MEFLPLGISGAWHVRSVVHRDDRGEFTEWFRIDRLEEHTGHRFEVAQANLSRSARGVVRGIHFADVPPGQAKLVTCVSGAIRDIVVDLRVGSPTFGQWEAVDLSSETRDAVVLPVGVGHGFVALTDDTLVAYLVSDVFKPHAEHGVHPLDETLAIDWVLPAEQLLLSPKDRQAPTFDEAHRLGMLPGFDGGHGR